MNNIYRFDDKSSFIGCNPEPNNLNIIDNIKDFQKLIDGIDVSASKPIAYSLHNLHLKNIDFASLSNFSNDISFNDCKLENCNFSSRVYRDLAFNYSDLSNCDFQNSKFQNLLINGTNMNDNNFNECLFHKSVIFNTNVEDSEYSRGFSGCVFYSSYLVDSYFKDVSLSATVFTDEESYAYKSKLDFLINETQSINAETNKNIDTPCKYFYSSFELDDVYRLDCANFYNCSLDFGLLENNKARSNFYNCSFELFIGNDNIDESYFNDHYLDKDKKELTKLEAHISEDNNSLDEMFDDFTKMEKEQKDKNNIRRR